MLVSIYRLFVFRLNNTFFRLNAMNDEVGFISDFNYFKTNGWYDTVANGCSPLYVLFTIPLNSFFNNTLLSMRILSIISMIGIILAWILFVYKYTKIPKEYKFISSLFLINVVMYRGVYYSATDDPLFIFFITLSFLSLFIGSVINQKINLLFILSGVFYAFALSTRQLFIFYFSGYVILFTILFFTNRLYLKPILFFFLSFILVVCVIHFPSIYEKKSLSFHDKNFTNKNVTWSEINYLFLIKNKDKLLYGRNYKIKPTPEEVVQYKKVNGEESLPKTYFSSIKKIPLKLHVQNYLHLAYLQALPFFRQIGILFPIFIICPLILFLRKKIKIFFLFPLFFYIFYVNSFCISPIVHLEFRWFMLFSVLASVFGVIYFFKYFSNYKYANYLLLINMIIVGILNIFYVGLW
jgi:hypothetical protein